MSSVVEKYIGKECVVTVMDKTVIGTIESVEEGWISLRSKESERVSPELINLEYVVRIREYPLKENGKKRTFVG